MKYKFQRIVFSILILFSIFFLITSKTGLPKELLLQRKSHLSPCGVGDIKAELNRLKNSNKFAICLIGDGVPDETLSGFRPYSIESAQGYDLYQGVLSAKSSQYFKSISSLVEVIFIDDGGNSECSKAISDQIIGYPNVLAVIGHSTSSTSKIAIKNYLKAQIPLILPAATSINLIDKCNVCFRLPSNDKVQANAIGKFLIDELKSKKNYLIWDRSLDSEEYSSSIMEELLKKYKIEFQNIQEVKFRPSQYSEAINSILIAQPEAIVFLGYGSAALEFFSDLERKTKIQNLDYKLPKIILSDGCFVTKINQLSNLGYESYISFPSDNCQMFESCISSDTFNFGEKSYEIFGHDALMLLSYSIKRSELDQKLNRRQVVKYLSTTNRYIETCYKYKFKNGENIYMRYYIYDLSSLCPVKNYSFEDLNIDIE